MARTARKRILASFITIDVSYSGMQRAVEGKSVNHDASNSSPRTDQKWRCGLIDAWRETKLAGRLISDLCEDMHLSQAYMTLVSVYRAKMVCRRPSFLGMW